MDLTPQKTTVVADDPTWLGSKHGTDTGITVTLDRSAFVAAGIGDDGFIPSGVALGKIDASGLYGPYDGKDTQTASDGTEVFAGVLLDPLTLKTGSTGDPVGALLWHGRVITANMPIGSNEVGGLPADQSGPAAELPTLRLT